MPREPSPPSDKIDKALIAGSVIASVVPWLGGPVSKVLSGMGTERKFTRIREVLDDLADQLNDFESEVAQEYVKTVDFEELLENTLKRAADERNPEVRAMYARFLRRAIAEPGDEYDNQFVVLRAVESLRNEHIVVLHALLAEPTSSEASLVAGSPMQTLEGRTGLDRDRIERVVGTLDDLKLAKARDGLFTMMTANGAASLQGKVTGLGIRVLDYLSPSKQKDNQ